jgi:hypothetical protein
VKLLKSPLRRTTAVLAGAFLGLAGAAVLAAPASAHAPTVSGTATCAKDGSWNIDWAVGNPMSFRATVHEIILDPQLPLTGAIADHSTVIPSHSDAHPRLQRHGATEVPATVDSVHIKVWLYWKLDNYTNIDPAEYTVNKPGDCGTPPTSEPSNPPSDEPSTPPSDEPSTPPSDEPSTPPSDEPSTPPSDEPSTPPTNQPPAPGEPTPILDRDCTSMTIGLDNPANGIPIPLHFETSKGEVRDVTINPGEKKVEKFSATPGFTVTVSVKGYEDKGETIAYEKPDNCDSAGSGGGGGLPVTGAAAGSIAGGAVALLAAGGVLFFMARRRKVKFTA